MCVTVAVLIPCQVKSCGHVIRIYRKAFSWIHAYRNTISAGNSLPEQPIRYLLRLLSREIKRLLLHCGSGTRIEYSAVSIGSHETGTMQKRCFRRPG